MEAMRLQHHIGAVEARPFSPFSYFSFGDRQDWDSLLHARIALYKNNIKLKKMLTGHD